jgi:hypothetical protein
MVSAKKAARRHETPKAKVDARVAGILAAIDVQRQKLKIPTLEELTRLARSLDKVPDNASTWHGWRDGSRSPKYVDLDDFARAVGLSVGLLSYSAPVDAETTSADEHQGAVVTSWMRKIETVMAGLPEEAQKEIYELAFDYRQRWGRASPSKAADE